MERIVFMILICKSISVVITISEENFVSTTSEPASSEQDEQKWLENFFEFFGVFGQMWEMMEYIDDDADPCQDFYKYACGDFNEARPMEPGKVGQGRVHQMAETINDDLHSVLTSNLTEEEFNNTNYPEEVAGTYHTIIKVRQFYNSCLSSEPFKFTSNSLYSDLVESLGGIPATSSNWSLDQFDLTSTIATLKLYGSTAFIDEYTSENYVYVRKGTDFGLLPMSVEDLNTISSKMYNINTGLMMHLLNLYGVDDDVAIDVIQDIMNFGKKFLNMTKDISPAKRKYYRITYLSKKVPEVDWIKYFSIIFGHPVDPNFKVIISDLNFFRAFPDLFKPDDMKIVANYLTLKLLFELHDELKSPRFVRNFCLRQIQTWLHPLPSLMYISSTLYNDDVEDQITEMVADIKNAFKDTIRNANWLDKETQLAALGKLEAMQVHVGTETLSIEFSKFYKYYKDLQIVPLNYHHNNINVRRHKTEKTHQMLGDGQPFGAKGDIAVNAYYQLTSNELFLPAGILQKPMFIPGMPFAYNFASMGGSIIGHELIHAFDSMGRHYDKNGDAVNWWSAASSEEFQRRAECFVDQYNQYRIEGLHVHVNGTSTLAENIADNGGLRLGYFAYKKWLQNHSEVDLDMFVDFDVDKLYFLSFAQASCSEFKRKGLLRIAEDIHTADKFRVNGPVTNFDEFAKTFECEVGTPMNSANKCVLW